MDGDGERLETDTVCYAMLAMPCQCMIIQYGLVRQPYVPYRTTVQYHIRNTEASDPACTCIMPHRPPHSYPYPSLPTSHLSVYSVLFNRTVPFHPMQQSTTHPHKRYSAIGLLSYYRIYLSAQPNQKAQIPPQARHRTISVLYFNSNLRQYNSFQKLSLPPPPQCFAPGLFVYFCLFARGGGLFVSQR
ncbi:hypothetical protein L873DRAFT_962060 [Choiromyces venosus 120613-1]|uniref:Uncharacterized protein n=1 Tax=Choiromyces venosus 120613-1 TaxID=1336337 RepID=A0A3N4K3Y9_9PEZI|nr:hypothetical protein L873DRAFT_962060 [Choiromyces venosus 120613-1]